MTRRSLLVVLLLAACPARPTAGPAAPAAHPAKLQGRLPDWNGDGYADLAIAAPGTQAEEIGRVFIYHGGAGGLAANPVTTLSGPDVVGAFFGRSLAALGDLDGDGFADLAVGAPGADQFTGRVYIYRGSANGLITEPAWTLLGPDGPGGWFGLALAGAGDVDRDGFADLAVAAPRSAGGRVHLYRGSAAGPRTPAAAIYRADGDGARLGAALAIAGDVNGDRFADVLAGAPGAAGEAGAALLFAGAADPLPVSPAVTVVGPPGLGQQWGASLALADLNADGFADALVGAPAAGALHIHLGARAGLSPSAALTIAGPDAASARFGSALTACGDVDGDAIGDFAVSSSAHEQWTGRVHFYRGMNQRPARSWTGPAGTYARFGSALACGGDADGNDHAELVVAAPGARKVYIYAGDLDGPSAEPALVIAAPAGSPGEFGAALALTPTR